MLTKTAIPTEARQIALRPLALGEKTGHHHSLVLLDATQEGLGEKVQMYEMEREGKRVFLRVTGQGVALAHQEHKPHAVEPGEYEVTIQTEVTDWGVAAVQD